MSLVEPLDTQSTSTNTPLEMKKLVLKSRSLEHLEYAFKEWLDVLGYCPKSVYGMPSLIREFFHFLESFHITLNLSPILYFFY